MSLESIHSAFLFRGKLEKKMGKNAWYYESPSLSFYRERLEEKCRGSSFLLIPQDGLGAAIRVSLGIAKPKLQTRITPFNSGAALTRARDFLVSYKEDILSLPALPKDNEYTRILKDNKRIIFTTLLPAAAALKRRSPELSSGDIIEKTKEYCVGEIEKVLSAFM